MAAGKDSPPFATAQGTPVTGGASNAGKPSGGAPDFTKTTQGSGGAPCAGRDFTKESRPQSEAKPEVEPAAGEIPKGGAELKADPSGPSGNSGANEGVNGKAPFKGLR